MVEVMREVRRVLRDDGVLWLNLGDSYSTASKSARDFDPKSAARATGSVRAIAQGEKPLDLLGVPWREALALQADGWYLRKDIIWSKRNPMPESLNGWRWERHRVKVAGGLRGKEQQRSASLGRPQSDHAHGSAHSEFLPSAKWSDCPGCDKCSPNDGLVLRRGAWRPTSAHEYIFQFTKSPDYFCDAQAVAEPVSGTAHARGGGVNPKCATPGNGVRQNEGFSAAVADLVAERNPRSVWDLTSKAFSSEDGEKEHYATFPPAIAERCIKASTSERGCCSACGAPWARVLGEREAAEGRGSGNGFARDHRMSVGGRGDEEKWTPTAVATVGWRATCSCAAPVAPCRVFDPFNGAGTTGLVALRLQRDYVGAEISAEYVALTKRRLGGDAPLFNLAAEAQ
jgi:hypothetical protein